jgi:hypothetical protein
MHKLLYLGGNFNIYFFRRENLSNKNGDIFLIKKARSFIERERNLLFCFVFTSWRDFFLTV